ncbi:hypothetical protein L228DRAFT_244216 [Xylona heveae TC161]|uniref:NOT2/NOT3/NOT5 C-terminal domain-containing protein n=1 Tax=Xylona heveae (strain CBS 132557 / TC161) TaxID=1328760 RepID=A0A165ITZ5_XYLHT|nr:hypothetical protein L228DRAFT_244216 [Xylona heveae TC161]KZF25389.1 hypothetical protein L228DRAFT_244216 [Xylona heveae TC161]
MNRPGPGPQPLRGIPGFPNQQPLPNRTAPLATGRLPNGKIGSGSNWGFGVPLGGAPGLPNPQSRPTSAAMTTFAQTLGASQPATPLDLSEFPSLSGSQPQHQNPSAQAVWANATQRASQHTPVQRPQPQSNVQASSSQARQQQTQQQAQPPQQQQPQSQPTQPQPPPQQDDALSTGSQLSGRLDDYRFGGQGGIGQLSGSSQPQTGSIDEFPPLGRNGTTEIGQDRRAGLMQNAAFGGPASAPGFPSNPQAARSPIDLRQGQNASFEQDKTNNLRHMQNGNSASLFSNPQSSIQSQVAQKQNALLDQQTRQAQSIQQQPQSFGRDLVDSPGSAPTPQRMQLVQMSELDRYGLPGLLGMIRHESEDLASLTVGQDLTALGLDLNQPDNNPLYHTFASPFAEAGSRPIEPEFTVPACYSVQNVHPLQSKVTSFSDETLFYIFYSMPKDIMQEVAAGELTNRNWRYHKEQKQWLTKDMNYEPVPLGPNEERGFYIFFDPNTWQRTRREFILHYDSLDSRNIRPLGNMTNP